MTQCFHYSFSLPIGHFHLAEVNGQLCALLTEEQLPSLQKQLERFIPGGVELLEKKTPVLQLAHRQLTEYFTGTRWKFHLPIQLYGSDFQQAVWQQLQQIPFGSTNTYGMIAAKLNQKGARAVGTAVGRNPLPIIIPCHRVLPQSGRLGNFSMSGGPAVKALLLDLEDIQYKP